MQAEALLALEGYSGNQVGALRPLPASVALVGSEYRSLRAELPAQVVELVDAFRNPITQIEFHREVQTLPVLELRESAMRLGLLRRYRGMLLATPRGRKLATTPSVLAHGRALLADNKSTIVVTADLMEPDQLLARPEITGFLDLSRPAAGRPDLVRDRLPHPR